MEIVGDQRIIDRVADALQPVTSRIVLAANDTSAQDWLPGVAVLRDEFERAGGLAGVHSALALGDALVVAWDMPFVTTELLQGLLEKEAPGVSVAAPENDARRDIEPFCAWYSASARDPLGNFLRSGGGAARDFIATLHGVASLTADEVGRIGDPRRLFFSVNTPDDLARARAMAGGPQ